MRPRDPIKEQTIRRKALEMMAVEGPGGFSMQKLARAAKVSPATLYIYFEDREDLLFQIWREQLEALSTAILKDFDPNASFEEGLWVQWNNRIRFYQEQPLVWRYLEQIMHSPILDEYHAKTGNPVGDSMGIFVSNAVRRGELTDFGLGEDIQSRYPREVLWALLFAPLYSLLQHQTREPGQKATSPSALEIEQTFQCVVRGLRP
jgi:AcrR family transcriptional regulator